LAGKFLLRFERLQNYPVGEKKETAGGQGLIFTSWHLLPEWKIRDHEKRLEEPTAQERTGEELTK